MGCASLKAQMPTVTFIVAASAPKSDHRIGCKVIGLRTPCPVAEGLGWTRVGGRTSDDSRTEGQTPGRRRHVPLENEAGMVERTIGKSTRRQESRTERGPAALGFAGARKRASDLSPERIIRTPQGRLGSRWRTRPNCSAAEGRRGQEETTRGPPRN